MEKIKKILIKLKNFTRNKGEKGKHIITLGGGEPTLREDLEEIIHIAKSLNFTVRIVTNGVLINEKRAESLRKSGLRFIQVSLDGGTAKRSR